MDLFRSRDRFLGEIKNQDIWLILTRFLRILKKIDGIEEVVIFGQLQICLVIEKIESDICQAFAKMWYTTLQDYKLIL